MRENKYYKGHGWVAKELFGSDFYSSEGKNSWEDTVEIRVKSLDDISDFISTMNVKKYLKLNTAFDGFFQYMFSYVPVGTAEDFCGSLQIYMAKKHLQSSVAPEAKPSRPDFQKLYHEFEDKYNPYPVQMSRCDAFGHAYRDGLITKEIYDQARDFYGSLWNYVGD